MDYSTGSNGATDPVGTGLEQILADEMATIAELEALRAELNQLRKEPCQQDNLPEFCVLAESSTPEEKGVININSQQDSHSTDSPPESEPDTAPSPSWSTSRWSNESQLCMSQREKQLEDRIQQLETQLNAVQTRLLEKEEALTQALSDKDASRAHAAGLLANLGEMYQRLEAKAQKDCVAKELAETRVQQLTLELAQSRQDVINNACLISELELGRDLAEAKLAALDDQAQTNDESVAQERAEAIEMALADCQLKLADKDVIIRELEQSRSALEAKLAAVGDKANNKPSKEEAPDTESRAAVPHNAPAQSALFQPLPDPGCAGSSDAIVGEAELQDRPRELVSLSPALPSPRDARPADSSPKSADRQIGPALPTHCLLRLPVPEDWGSADGVLREAEQRIDPSELIALSPKSPSPGDAFKDLIAQTRQLATTHVTTYAATHADACDQMALRVVQRSTASAQASEEASAPSASPTRTFRNVSISVRSPHVGAPRAMLPAATVPLTPATPASSPQSQRSVRAEVPAFFAGGSHIATSIAQPARSPQQCSRPPVGMHRSGALSPPSVSKHLQQSPVDASRRSMEVPRTEIPTIGHSSPIRPPVVMWPAVGTALVAKAHTPGSECEDSGVPLQGVAKHLSPAPPVTHWAPQNSPTPAPPMAPWVRLESPPAPAVPVAQWAHQEQPASPVGQFRLSPAHNSRLDASKRRIGPAHHRACPGSATPPCAAVTYPGAQHSHLAPQGVSCTSADCPGTYGSVTAPKGGRFVGSPAVVRRENRAPSVPQPRLAAFNPGMRYQEAFFDQSAAGAFALQAL